MGKACSGPPSTRCCTGPTSTVGTYGHGVSRPAAKAHAVPGRVCCFADRAGKGWNELVAGFADGFAFLDLSSGRRDLIASFEPDQPTTRLNDGRTDRQGRFMAGGMDEAGSCTDLVRLATGSGSQRHPAFRRVSAAPTVPASRRTGAPCGSPTARTGASRRSPTIRLSGALGQRRTVARTPPPGVPDGSCVDREGYVWNAVWEGYRVERYAPDGRLDRVIEVPVRKPTCCAFGGAELDTLFITTSRLDETAEQLAREPLAGALFAVKAGVSGCEDTPFAG